jgi:hypothetical protein
MLIVDSTAVVIVVAPDSEGLRFSAPKSQPSGNELPSGGKSLPVFCLCPMKWTSPLRGPAHRGCYIKSANVYFDTVLEPCL